MLPDLVIPYRSAWDPATASEGALDPLGLTLLADRMAVHMVPGVRERQSDPRWLVACCVGAVVNSWFDPDQVAADGLSSPSMVYEWHVAAALVSEGLSEGMPGRLKVRRALERGEPISRQNYLKTASVFGFQGVYRVLGVSLRLMDRDGQLLERGAELLEVWMRKQGQPGFISGNGHGRDLRRRLEQLVKSGLKTGHSSRMSPADKRLLKDALSPKRMGNQVRGRLWSLLQEPGETGGWRNWFLDVLASPTAARVLAQRSERKTFEWLLRQHPPHELRPWLKAVLAYEAYARLLENAFEAVLYKASVRQPISVSGLAGERSIKKAAKSISRHYQVAIDALARLEEPGLKEELSARFQEVSMSTASIEEWVSGLLVHHERIQKDKPPEGKAPWFDRFGNDRILTRPRYWRESLGKQENDFVNRYRTVPLRKFAEHLGRTES